MPVEKQEKQIKVLIERGCENHKYCRRFLKYLDDTVKDFCSLDSTIVFILYCSNRYLRQIMQEMGDQSNGIKLVLVCVDDLEWKDVLETSKINKQISGWIHAKLSIEEIKFVVMNALSGKSTVVILPETSLISYEYDYVVENRSIDNYHSLTDREIEVLALITEGASNKKIAEILYISENTVKTHVRRILEKLQFDSRTKAALYAIDNLIVDQSHKVKSHT